MEDFYTINLSKKTNPARGHVAASKLQDSRVDAFRRLGDNLDFCFEKKVIDFYASILEQLKSLFKSSDDGIPSLFIQGHCVDWTSIFKKVEQLWRDSHMVCFVTPEEVALKQLLIAIRTADERRLDLIVVMLQVECFPRNSLLDSVIQLLVNNSATLKSYLLINSAIECATILDRINRVNFTYLNIRTLELTPPDQLLNDIFDMLLDGSALGDGCLQFAGDVLLLARFRYLYEDFSLSELRKSLLFALAVHLCRCREETLNIVIAKPGKKSSTATSRSGYVKVLNCLVLLKIESNHELDATHEFLEIHSKIQSDDDFLAGFLGAMKTSFSDWNKEKWTAVLRKVEEQLSQSQATSTELENLPALYEILSKSQTELENNESKSKVEPNASAKKQRQRAHEFLTNKTKMMQAQRNLPSYEELKLINGFLGDLFRKFLDKMDPEFLVGIPPEKLTYLETSNVRHMDEVMNPHVEIDSGSQLDIVMLYHALVESSSQTVAVDLTDTFDKFAACLSSSGRRGAPTIQSRFFNALAQLEYIGIVAVSASEKTLRLTYLPMPTTLQSAAESSNAH